ncbi:RING-H2 finger protein ATL43 [Magnolia sinica]|uniref:RING-H2 finger protein ATL43 n=1 Tax=Magnolia sinica TaxID=86752 RepID=UPI002657EAAA|nr:RING-H2 finger protein ATL43 [Magnolia sinica]
MGFLTETLFWILFSFCSVLLMAEDTVKNPSTASDSILSPNPSPPSAQPPKSNLAPFRPSIAVIVGVLTTMFSITFLLLLYAKHCKRSSGGGSGYGSNTNSGFAPSTARRNSGIDRVVIESLPVFRFSSLRGQKEGLECAVCLNRFEPAEVLRLLPKCKHAFHVECVDTWLDAHSTCPLCRYRVDPEDVLLVEEAEPISKPEEETGEEKAGKANRSRTGTPQLQTGFIRVSGRHSSAGEKSSGSRPFDPDAREASFRRSVDNGSLKGEAVRLGCFDRAGQKDGALLTGAAGTADRKRFEHRIIISDVGSLQRRRWSDLKPSDLLFLRSEMILTDSGRYSLSCARAPCSSATSSKHPLQLQSQRREDVRLSVADDIDGTSGRSVINSRCVSEITGLSRLRREEEEKAVKRWLGFEPRRTGNS